MLFCGILTATRDRIDKIERIARPQDLHKMQRLWHLCDAVQAPMETVIDSTRSRTVAYFKGLREFVCQRSQLSDVLCCDLVDGATTQPRFQQQPQLQHFFRSRRIEGNYARSAIR